MSLLRRHGIFIALGVLGLLALVGLVLSWNAAEQNKGSERRVKTLENRLQGFATINPAPTEANLAQVRGELANLNSLLRAYGEAFSASRNLQARGDAVSVLPRIQGLVVDYRRRFQQGGIRLNENESFSLSRYDREGEPPPVEAIPQLDKQLQVLEELLKVLLESRPSALVKVEREAVELPAANVAGRSGGRRDVRSDFFEIPTEASARVPGLVETLAFRFTFTGYTESLRQLLNRLDTLSLPIVVRSVEVMQARPVSETIPVPRGTGAGGESPFAALFGPSEPVVAAPPDRESIQQKPIIEDNISEFRVTVEFVELLLDRLNQELESEGA